MVSKGNIYIVMKIGDDGFTKIFKGDKLRSTQQHHSANFSESDLVFKEISFCY